MAPVAHVLVYYVREDGEIIADSLDVELDGTLQNHVSNNREKRIFFSFYSKFQGFFFNLFTCLRLKLKQM